jgi:hypothetical protein
MSFATGAGSFILGAMAYYRGMTFMELRRSMRLVEEHRNYLLEQWHDYFGS